MSEIARSSGRKFEDIRTGFKIPVLSNAINDRNDKLVGLEPGSTERVRLASEIGALMEKRGQLLIEREGVAPDRARELTAMIMNEAMLLVEYGSGVHAPISDIRMGLYGGYRPFNMDSLAQDLDPTIFNDGSPSQS
jgi:hypothetical protein